jgi:tetratricopeptide (TPR) repeat protein
MKNISVLIFIAVGSISIPINIYNLPAAATINNNKQASQNNQDHHFSQIKQSTQATPSTQQISLDQEDTFIAEIYVKTGRLLWNNKDYLKAIEALNKAIDTDPNYAEAYYWRGVCHDSLEEVNPAMTDKEMALAIADFNRVIELDKKYGKAYYMRGLNYGSSKKYNLAIADLKIAVKLLTASGDIEYAKEAKRSIEAYTILKH